MSQDEHRGNEHTFEAPWDITAQVHKLSCHLPIVDDRVHIYINIGPGGGVVPEGERLIPVKEDGHRVHVGQYTSDVRCRAETAN